MTNACEEVPEDVTEPVPEETQEPETEQAAPCEEENAAEPEAVDEELNRIVGIFKLAREQGYTLKLIPGTPEENAPVFDFENERILRPAAYAPMSEIIFVSRTQISENGNVILYEKRYHGVLTENGSVRLRAYCAKRIPLGTVAAAKASAQAARNWKGAA